MDSIRDVKPGQYDDPVESLARAIHETAFTTMRELEKIMGPATILPYHGITDWHALPDYLQQVCRIQARLLLERMNR
jgi:hypothetical protein